MTNRKTIARWRAEMAVILRENGLTYKEIGGVFNVTPCRGRELFFYGARRKNRARMERGLPPAYPELVREWDHCGIKVKLTVEDLASMSPGFVSLLQDSEASQYPDCQAAALKA